MLLFLMDCDHSNPFLMSLICGSRIKEKVGLSTDMTYSQVLQNSNCAFVHFSQGISEIQINLTWVEG